MAIEQTLQIMKSEAPGKHGGAGLILLAIFWLIGTPVLAYFAVVQLMNGIDGTDSPNQKLALLLVIATAAAAIGLPLIGFFVALATRRKVAAALFAAALAALLLAAGQAGLLPIDQVFSSSTSNEPEVCTGPPGASEGVPGC
jgi:hypothetical protein